MVQDSSLLLLVPHRCLSWKLISLLDHPENSMAATPTFCLCGHIRGGCFKDFPCPELWAKYFGLHTWFCLPGLPQWQRLWISSASSFSKFCFSDFFCASAPKNKLHSRRLSSGVCASWKIFHCYSTHPYVFQSLPGLTWTWTALCCLCWWHPKLTLLVLHRLCSVQLHSGFPPYKRACCDILRQEKRKILHP